MFKDVSGNSVPNVTFPMRKNGEWVNVTTDDLFKGKTVVVFSLPGAFTPTCSSTHLPRYSELRDTFTKQGVDDILCVSVNDTFVMNAWQEDQKIDNITMIPDGNGEFTDGMGLLVDKKELGFGKRSWRYSMLVRDGVVEKMFIEPNEPGDPFKVSDADTMLAYIAPEYKLADAVTVFTRTGCPYCTKAKEMLAMRGIAFEEVVVGADGNVNTLTLRAVTGDDVVPQVFVGGTKIGGSDELADFLK